MYPRVAHGVAHDVAAKPHAAKPRPTRPRGKAAALHHVAARGKAAYNLVLFKTLIVHSKSHIWLSF